MFYAVYFSHFDVKAIIFSTFWPAAFPKIAGKIPDPPPPCITNHLCQQFFNHDKKFLVLNVLPEDTTVPLLWLEPGTFQSQDASDVQIISNN